MMLLFWVLIFFIWMTVLVNCEMPVGATWVVFLFAAIYLIIDRTKFVLIMGNIFTLKFMIYLAIYLLLGVIWSFIKWYFFLLNEKESQKSFLWESERLSGKKRFTVPQVGQHKSLIMTWMCYWPFSMWWTILNDPVKRIFNWMYQKFQKQYQHIANSVFEEGN